ncbi:MAG: hypothetical protein NDI94_01105 [Candidatus Woesearchaeota archaeon]|nr:hypothetical protein [Candidatus Woesearchaeota archaeon]
MHNGFGVKAVFESWYFFLAALLIGLLVFSKAAFFIFAFFLLDVFKNILELRLWMNYFPIKIMEIGIITVSYIFGFKAGLVLVILYFMNKAAFSRIDNRFVIDLFPLMIICILADILSSMPFPWIAIVLFVLRYFLDIIFEFMFAYAITLKNLPARVLNSIVAFFIFNLISSFI